MSGICRHLKGKGFPTDFLLQLADFECLTCAMMKGVRNYRKSTLMKKKSKKSNQIQPTFSSVTDGYKSNLTSFENQSTSPVINSYDKDRYEDDFLRAMPANATDEEACDNDMFIDFAHTIALGYHNEKYYLVIVVGGVDFLRATRLQHNPSWRSCFKSLSPSRGSRSGEFVWMEHLFSSTRQPLQPGSSIMELPSVL